VAEPQELAACTPNSLNPDGFNSRARLPYGLKVDHVKTAMEEFIDFLGFINQQLNTRDLARLESLLMPANFSSVVGEMMGASIPKYCPTLIRNPYHNGYPDLIPADRFPPAGVLHGDEGIEIKASRYVSGWQGHNPEEGFFLIFVFDSNRPVDASKGATPRPFRFVRVVGETLTREDWNPAGRPKDGRRTPTAGVGKSGHTRMLENWIYDEAFKGPN
jgi:hypothetical protein